MLFRYPIRVGGGGSGSGTTTGTDDYPFKDLPHCLLTSAGLVRWLSCRGRSQNSTPSTVNAWTL